MNIERVFSTGERVLILKEIIPLDGVFGVNEVAKRLGLSKGLVSKYFEILAKEGVVRRRGSKYLVLDNSTVRAIKIMLNVLAVNPRIFRKYRFVKSAGLYGSCAKGMNSADSDVDVWVKVSKASERERAELTAELRKKIPNVRPLILDDKKLEKIKKEDAVFYHSLFFGSIMLYGVENEL